MDGFYFSSILNGQTAAPTHVKNSSPHSLEIIVGIASKERWSSHVKSVTLRLI